MIKTKVTYPAKQHIAEYLREMSEEKLERLAEQERDRIDRIEACIIADSFDSEEMLSRMDVVGFVVAEEIGDDYDDGYHGFDDGDFFA